VSRRRSTFVPILWTPRAQLAFVLVATLLAVTLAPVVVVMAFEMWGMS
jgi:hypothetical protein